MPDYPGKLLLSLKPDTPNAYRRRVAAWCSELARAQATGPEQELAREQTAFGGHRLPSVLDGPRRAQFLQDLNVSIAEPQVSAAQPDAKALELAEALEDHFAWEPYSGDAPEVEPAAAEALDALRTVRPPDLERAMANLPVLPVAAHRALALLTSDNWEVRALQSIATSDPVLAAELIRAANSAAFAARQEIKTMVQAIAYIGTEQACRILVGASLKRLFVAKKLQGLWNHCLEASRIAQSVAKLSHEVNSEEALLAGLVHDVGRLATSLLPDQFQNRSQRLLASGCTLSQVEIALCGAAHAELGARALERWNFPQDFVEAVRFHHQPERSSSPLAAVLYLTELCSSPLEDVPSLARAKAALDRLGLDADAQYEIELAEQSLRSLHLEEWRRL
ncbi:MAG TPA: HDOD domain-containing protein [Bryobacteraceae bacterium]|nr:HDOD domain-containing protein [Bryobacteraceae bacterium]